MFLACVRRFHMNPAEMLHVVWREHRNRSLIQTFTNLYGGGGLEKLSGSLVSQRAVGEVPASFMFFYAIVKGIVPATTVTTCMHSFM